MEAIRNFFRGISMASPKSSNDPITTTISPVSAPKDETLYQSGSAKWIFFVLFVLMFLLFMLWAIYEEYKEQQARDAQNAARRKQTRNVQV